MTVFQNATLTRALDRYRLAASKPEPKPRLRPVTARPSNVDRPLYQPASMQDIVAVLCEGLGVTVEGLASSRRHPQIVIARALATRLARELTVQSYPEIAHRLGRPNHSTVITADQTLSRRLGLEIGAEDRTFVWKSETKDLAFILDDARLDIRARQKPYTGAA